MSATDKKARAPREESGEGRSTQWKSSPVDEAALKRWDDYSAARNEMLARTHSMTAPWTIVNANSKPLARINIIRDLLTRLDFDGKDRQADLPDPDIVFSFHENGIRDGSIAK